MRTSPAETPDIPAARLIPWIVLAVAVLGGAVAAVRLDRNVTPLLDLLR